MDKSKARCTVLLRVVEGRFELHDDNLEANRYIRELKGAGLVIEHTAVCDRYKWVCVHPFATPPQRSTVFSRIF
jgi:hypothetical protein